MWYAQRERERFVERLMYDIINDNRLEHELKYKLEKVGEKEIKSEISKIVNQKVKSSYPRNIMEFHSEELIKDIKGEFLNTLKNKY